MSVRRPTVVGMAGEILDPRTNPRACALVLRQLRANETEWRQRVGDEDYDNAIRSWEECLARLRHPARPPGDVQGN